METIECYLTHHEYFIKMLPEGAENAIPQEKLYKQYVKALQDYDEQYRNPDNIISKDTFKRKARYLSEEARNKGIRVVHNQKGLFLAVNDAEWEEFVRHERSRAESILRQLAAGAGKTFGKFIKELYFNDSGRKDKHHKDQLNFLES